MFGWPGAGPELKCNNVSFSSPIGPDKMNRTTGVNTLLHDEVNVAFGTGFW